MSGPNQHYIPSFLQRGFGVRPRRLTIWRFGLGEDPQCRRIKRTGASDHFYSPPSPDGRLMLDDAITAVEQRISPRLRDIRAMPPGARVGAEIAAAVVSHLATRTAHVRSTLGDGLGRLLERAQDLFSKPANVEALIELDNMRSLAVGEAMAGVLERWPGIGQTGIPEPVIERVVSALLREMWPIFAKDAAKLMEDLLGVIQDRSAETVRDAHRKGLADNMTVNPLEEALRTLAWSIESAPAPGAILPDCVVVVFDKDGKAGTHLAVGPTGIHAAIMAVSTEKLLVGRTPASSLPTTLCDYNETAARVSRDFFLAPRNDAETERLHGLIGTDLGSAWDESLAGAFDQFLPERAAAGRTDLGAEEDDAPSWKATTGLDYDVSVTGCGDEDNNRAVEGLLREFVNVVAKALPLDRLDGITVSDDYPAALRAVDQGYENARPATTVSAEIGVGVAKTVHVRRSGVVKGRVVLANTVCGWLFAEDRMVVDWGWRTLVSQLASVAMMQMVDEALPGHLLAPVRCGPVGRLLYQVVDGVPNHYVAAWTAAAFGDGTETLVGQRELLATCLDRIRSKASEARLAWRTGDDGSAFLDAVLPEIGNVLMLAAGLAGHCASAGVPALEDGGDLADALGRTGLGRWFEVYQADLERFRGRLGKWESFDELMAFNRHAERLLWGVGMVLWEEGDSFRFLLSEDDVLLDPGAYG